MKAYTDIEQSKKLAEILPVESADMHYNVVGDAIIGDYQSGISSAKSIAKAYTKNPDEFAKNVIPCWSLAALLELIPKHIKQEDGRTYKFHIFNDDGRVIQRWGCSYVAEDYHNRAEYLSDPHLKYPTNIYSDKYQDPIDACYEMIIKLHKQKLL